MESRMRANPHVRFGVGEKVEITSKPYLSLCDIVADLTEGIHLQVGGVKNFRLLFEPTLELEPKKVIIAFDADAQTKEADVGATVLQCIDEARELLTPRGIKLYYAGWHISEGNGIDDLMMGKKISPNLYPLN
jgi:hypothetical protein